MTTILHKIIDLLTLPTFSLGTFTMALRKSYIKFLLKFHLVTRPFSRGAHVAKKGSLSMFAKPVRHWESQYRKHRLIFPQISSFAVKISSTRLLNMQIISNEFASLSNCLGDDKTPERSQVPCSRINYAFQLNDVCCSLSSAIARI